MWTEKRSVHVEDQVEEFLTETQRLQQRYELDRIASKCFAQNPLEVFGLPASAAPSDVAKQFRALSLLCHPDKVDKEMKHQAEKVFHILNNAKLTLTEPDKRAAFDTILQQAREQVTEKQQTNKQLQSINDEEYDRILNEEIKEIMIERAWTARQAVKAATLAAERTEAERQQQIKQREEASKELKEHDDADKRESRAQSWRNFMNKSGSRLNKRPPPSTAPEFSANHSNKRAR